MAQTYNREAAVAYADRWWNGANPEYRYFEGNDCTNFISQCLFAGGMPMESTGRRDAGWWYTGGNSPAADWSFSWTVAHSLRWYLAQGHRAAEASSPMQLKIGDVISYDWTGDEVWEHSTMVVAHAPDGTPLVNAHTWSAWRQPWHYRTTAATQHKFWRIKDAFDVYSARRLGAYQPDLVWNWARQR